MDKNKYLEEMIGTIQEFGQCTIYLSDGDMICIEPAENFIGGEEGYYMCDVLGNIQYYDIANICEEVLEYIEVDIDSIEVD